MYSPLTDNNVGKTWGGGSSRVDRVSGEGGGICNIVNDKDKFKKRKQNTAVLWLSLVSEGFAGKIAYETLLSVLVF